MQLTFAPQDEAGFAAARDVLVQGFERWLIAEGLASIKGAPEVAGDAGLALDWKWGYADGHLGRWDTGDVRDFLLDWCPRKLSIPQAECGSIPGALAGFLGYLADGGLLAPGSSSVPELAEAVAAVGEEFFDAMGDASQFGLAKTLFGAAAADGVDLTDRDRLDQWIAEFNARPAEERHRVIPDSALARPPRLVLPPVALPDDAEVAASKAAAPIVGMFTAFAGFVGTGRKLTQTGRLTLADARALVELMATGDTVDQQVGNRTFRTRSSDELLRLRLIFAWARKAGVVRVVHGRVVATKRGASIAKDPGGCYDRAVRALMDMGPLSSQRDPDWWLAWPAVNEVLDSFAEHLLLGPYVAEGPVPLGRLAELAADTVLDAFSFRIPEADVARHVETDVIDIMDAFELAGVVCRADVDPPDDDAWLPERRRRGGTVELTPAGVVTVQRLLAEAGYEAPLAGRFADATATELLLGTDLDEFPALWAEIAAWHRRREPAQAARELAAAVRELEDPALRNVALGLMGDIGPEVAGPEVRKLTEEPTARGFALCWLVDHGLEDEGVLYDTTDVSWFVDVLVQRLVMSGPDALLGTLARAGGHDRQIEVITRLWRSPSGATDAVLAAIGELHPVKAVAKAARKARFQRRSWLGG